MKYHLIILALVLCSVCKFTICARILGVFPFAAPSHYRLGHSLMKGLAEAGHDVTMISPNEDKKPPSKGSYKNVILTGFNEDHQKLDQLVNFLKTDGFDSSFLRMIIFQSMLIPLNERVFNHTNIKKLLVSNEQFDIVIVEQFINDALKVFAHHYNAPLIMLSTIGPSSWVNNLVGNPAPLSYIPHILCNYSPKMNILEKTHNVLTSLFEELVNYFYYFPQNNAIVKKYFPNSPDIYELYYNVSLVLLNYHESMGQAVPLVPNMVPIGGYHVQPPKKLPKDLQDFLDNAKDGVVYFSLGSNLKSKDLPPHKRDMFLNAFSKLKQKVLWKWEDDVLPNQPKNVKLGKWLPQQDILAHPNVKLFITHGGLLSLTETVYHGVPVLAIPVFADQHKNAYAAATNGYALSLPYHDPEFSEEKLLGAIQAMLENPKYSENVKRRSKIFHDRPLKPMETAVYWVEYVLRHKGAPHLRVAGVELPWYQYLLLDVAGFLLGCIVLVFVLLRLVFRKLCRCRREAIIGDNKLKIN